MFEQRIDGCLIMNEEFLERKQQSDATVLSTSLTHATDPAVTEVVEPAGVGTGSDPEFGGMQSVQ